MCVNDKFAANLAAINNLFDFLNSTFFENKLSKPVITIQRNKKSGVLGWFTAYEAWQAEKETSPEINMSADYLDRSPIEKAETLLHEMCHLHAYASEIQDCSRSGTYHNKRYKEIAEAHGLTVTKSQKGGWNMTALTPAAHALIAPYVENIEPLRRITPASATKSKSNVRKYVCPECGCIVRATKEVRISCNDCDQIMTEE